MEATTMMMTSRTPAPRVRRVRRGGGGTCERAFTSRTRSSIMRRGRTCEKRCEKRRRPGRGQRGGVGEFGCRAGELFSAVDLVVPGRELASVADAAGYSKSSYYTALGLFLFSLPGLWSLIKRSTKSKIVKKSYEIPGPGATGASF